MNVCLFNGDTIEIRKKIQNLCIGKRINALELGFMYKNVIM